MAEITVKGKGMQLDPPAAINRLVVAVVDSDDAGALADRLVSRGFGVTRLETAGGFLRRGNTTILIGTSVARLEVAMATIQSVCQTRVISTFEAFAQSTPDMLPAVPIEVEVGGATVFICDVERTVYLGT